MPKVTVIVTAYNNAKFLPDCIASLKNQTEPDLEFICIDDCSTDDTATILKDLTKDDPRFKLILNSENLGVSRSRNLGIEKAESDFVMFCDGDDYYDETMCAEMYQVITDHHVDLAISEIAITYHAHSEMRRSDENYYSLKFSGLETMRDELILKTDLAPTNKIFKKSLLDAYNIRFPKDLRFEDAYFCCAYFCVSKSAYYLNKQLYHYIRHASSAMSDTWSKDSDTDFAIDHLTISFRLYDFLTEHCLLERYNSAFWQLFHDFEAFALNNSKTSARRADIKAQAQDFISRHASDFTKIPAELQAQIRSQNSRQPNLSSPSFKRTLLKFLPTFHLAIRNVERLRLLETKITALSQALDEISAQLTEFIPTEPINSIPDDLAEPHSDDIANSDQKGSAS